MSVTLAGTTLAQISLAQMENLENLNFLVVYRMELE